MPFYKEKYVGEVEKLDIGEKIKTAGWVNEIRWIGKITFIILRDETGKIQVVAKSDIENYEEIKKLNREDVISVEGIIKEKKGGGKEIEATHIEVLNKVIKKLPVDTTNKIESELDTRLNYRFLDTRKENINKIFKLKSLVANHFRTFFINKGFTEIFPPTITAEATEGGADLFPIKYFEYNAYLTQSPQLYKQMAVIGGLEKVFMISHIYRAEKHNTTTHLNEAVAMDIEAAFHNHFDVMKLLEEFMIDLTKTLSKKFDEINEITEIQYLTYEEALETLKSSGKEKEWGEDLSREDEGILHKKVGEAFFIYKWPSLLRPFYSMEEDEKHCRAFDLIYRGLEIASGAQRIHQPKQLEESLRKRNLNPLNFEFYIEAFRYGAPPHSGWSIGLERITMKLLNLKNIREASLFPRDRHRIKP